MPGETAVTPTTPTGKAAPYHRDPYLTGIEQIFEVKSSDRYLQLQVVTCSLADDFVSGMSSRH